MEAKLPRDGFLSQVKTTTVESHATLTFHSPFFQPRRRTLRSGYTTLCGDKCGAKSPPTKDDRTGKLKGT
jgi:hypothetical protein